MPSNRRAKPRAKPSPIAAPHADVGAALAIERKLVEVETAALIPDDPDSRRGNSRLGTRARRVWAPEWLARGRSPAIDRTQLMAAELLRDDYEMGVHGAKPTLGLDMSIRSDNWNRLAWNEQRMLRRQRFERATGVLGPLLGDLVAWVVLSETPGPTHPPSCEGWGKAQRPAAWSTERCVGLLSGALELLASFYGLRRGEAGRA